MSHLAEINFQLKTRYFSKEDLNLVSLNKIKNYDVVFIKTPLFNTYLPQIFSRNDFENSSIKTILEFIFNISESLNNNCKLIILTEPYIIPYIQTILTETFKYQQWIVLKLKNQSLIKNAGLLNCHLGLLILTKNRKPLQISKIRLPYTFCPYCHKTTKDYGGRKHLYHEYGTLMSDIWKDLSISRQDKFDDSHEVVIRIRDMFSIEEKRGNNNSKIKNKNMAILSIDNIKDLSNLVKNIPITNLEFDKIFPNIKSILVTNKKIDTSGSMLIHGDSLEILKKIPDNSADLIFVDPPYNLNKKYDSYSDDLEITNYFEWCDSWIENLVRILKIGGSFFLVNIPLYSIRHFLYLQQRLTFQNWIVWDSLSLPVRNIMPCHYSILFYTKGPKPYMLNVSKPDIIAKEDSSELSFLLSLKDNYCLRNTCVKKRLKEKITQYQDLTDVWSGIHRLKHNSRRFDHPTQLPPILLKRIIDIFSDQNDLVLDAFNGIGTTTLCADLLNRRYIGIEISKKYYEIALQNHEEIKMNQDPFRKKKPKPKAKNTKVIRQGLIKYKVPKKELQLYVKELANKIGRKPTRDDVLKEGKYPIKYFDNYFKGWGEVLAAVRTTGMSEYKIEPEILIAYFKKLSKKLNKIPNRQDLIDDNQYPIEYFLNYFQNWDEIIIKAGIESKTKQNDLDKWLNSTR